MLIIWLTLCILYQGFWLFSKSVYGQIESFGHGNGRKWKHVENISVTYVVSSKVYEATYLRNEWENDSIPIRYLLIAPSVSRPDTTAGNWGLIIVSSSIFFLCATAIFLIKDIIPQNAVFVLDHRFPFIGISRIGKEG